MASGFLVLPDGRCFSCRWSAHDAVLRAVADELEASEAVELRAWLLSLIPGQADEEHVGYGPWYRVADGQLIERTLDLRELTPRNQSLICEAAKQASSHGEDRHPKWLADSLSKLSDMVTRMEHGEAPLSRSDWVEIVPSEGCKVGPGWPAA